MAARARLTGKTYARIQPLEKGRIVDAHCRQLRFMRIPRFEIVEVLVCTATADPYVHYRVCRSYTRGAEEAGKHAARLIGSEPGGKAVSSHHAVLRVYLQSDAPMSSAWRERRHPCAFQACTADPDSSCTAD